MSNYRAVSEALTSISVTSLPNPDSLYVDEEAEHSQYYSEHRDDFEDEIEDDDDDIEYSEDDEEDEYEEDEEEDDLLEESAPLPSDTTTLLTPEIINGKKKQFIIKGVDYSDNEIIIISAPRTIKLSVPLTKEKILIDDVVFVAHIDSNRIGVITALNGKKLTTFYHPNLSGGTGGLFSMKTEDGEKITYRFSSFCNPMRAKDLKAKPREMSYILCLNLEAPNVADSYEGQRNHLNKNVSITEKDLGIFCTKCKSFMDKKTPKVNLISQLCPLCLEKENLSDLDLSSSGYYCKKKENNRYVKYKTKDIKDTSPYYETILASDILKEIADIPKTSKDIIVMGLGSAGSSIVELLGRTNLVNDYVLIDFDKVETKNLRNQIYDNDDIRNFKTDSISRKLTKLNKSSIKTYNSKFEDVTFQFIKSKYIVLGFDTILTRMSALEKIASGEIESKYIIDARYDDLLSSLYFIDVENRKEMSYYKNFLEADLEIFGEVAEAETETIDIEEVKKTVRVYTEKEIHSIWSETNAFNNMCAMHRSKFGLNISCPRSGLCSGSSGDCIPELTKRINTAVLAKAIVDKKKETKFVPITIESLHDVLTAYSTSTMRCPQVNCGWFSTEILGLYGHYNFCDTPQGKEQFAKAKITSFDCNRHYANGNICAQQMVNYINENKIVIPGVSDRRSASTCLKQNIIDIYKTTSSAVVSAIREIEEGREKPFVHLEISTEAIPKIMKLK